MNTQFTEIIKKEGDWWIGWIEEVSGVNAQERTKDKLIESLREALFAIIELNREEARREAVSDYEEVSIEVAGKAEPGAAVFRYDSRQLVRYGSVFVVV